MKFDLINIKNKNQSDYWIQKLKLNKVNFCTFTKVQVNEVIQYMNNNPCQFYSMRSKIKSSGKFLYGLTRQEVLNNINNFELFSISESLINADNNHLLLQGSIQITNDWICKASLSDELGISNRQAENNPKYKLCFDLIDDYEPSILGLKHVIDYYIIHELFNAIMEFTLYDISMGVNKENIIIWELRKY